MSADDVPAELLLLRQQIDRLDHSLVLLLADRFALTQQVGRLKAEFKLQPFDPLREECKLRDIRQLCEQHQVNPELVAEILARVMREVVKNHKRISEES